jgi:hypothetical protein
VIIKTYSGIYKFESSSSIAVQRSSIARSSGGGIFSRAGLAREDLVELHDTAAVCGTDDWDYDFAVLVDAVREN